MRWTSQAVLSSAAMAVVLAGGCFGVYMPSLAVGRGAVGKPRDCPVRYEPISSREAQDRYEQVGVLCYPPYFAHPTRNEQGFLDVAREPTCRLGGEIVVSHGFCPFGGGNGLELGVYVSKGPPPRPLTGPQTGTPPPQTSPPAPPSP